MCVYICGWNLVQDPKFDELMTRSLGLGFHGNRWSQYAMVTFAFS